MSVRAFLLASALALAPQTAPAQTMGVAGSTVTITPKARAYTPGSCLGGVIQAAGLARLQGTGTILTGVTFIDPSKQSATNDAQTIYVFNVKPFGSYVDQASCSLAAADIPLLVGQVAISARSCISDAANTVCTIRPSLTIPPPSATYSLATNGASAAGAIVLRFPAVPSFITPGMRITDTTIPTAIPESAIVTSTTSTTVSMSVAAAAPVGNGDSITFSQTTMLSTSIWVVPFVTATPIYGTSKLTYQFTATPYSGN